MPPSRPKRGDRRRARARAPTSRSSRCCRAAAVMKSSAMLPTSSAQPTRSGAGCPPFSSSWRGRRTCPAICCSPSTGSTSRRDRRGARRRRAGRGGCGAGRIGDRHRAGRAARVSDGRRLPAVAADVSARPPFVRVDTFAMANLVAGKRVVPELIQDDFTPDAVAREALADPHQSAHAARGMRRELARGPQAARRARRERARRTRGAPGRASPGLPPEGGPPTALRLSEAACDRLRDASAGLAQPLGSCLDPLPRSRRASARPCSCPRNSAKSSTGRTSSPTAG